MSSAGKPQRETPALRETPREATSPPLGPAPARPGVVARTSWRRVADLFALVCVAGAALSVGLAAAPSVARELGWTRASLSRRPWNTPSTGAAPRNEPILLDPDVFAPPGRAPSIAPGRAMDQIDVDEDRAPPARFAVAVRDVVVRSAASEGARSVAQVPRGELLLVIREEGEWAMVAHIADDGGTTGWVRSGDLAIR